jgi:hypothetical protein
VAIGLAVFGWFCWKYYWPFVPSAYTDHLFALLVFVTILATVRAVTSWSWSAWFVAGLTAAAGAATRPSLMTYPIVLAAFIVLGWTEKQRWLRIRAALVMAAGFLTGVAPFTIRNYIVSGTPVLLVNSWIQIPYFLYDPNEPNKATQVFGLWDALQQAATLFAARPAQVIAIELRKLGFTLGWLKLGPSGEPATFEFVTLFLLFLEALLLARIPRVLAFVLCAFAVSHTTAMILAAPWTPSTNLSCRCTSHPWRGISRTLETGRPSDSDLKGIRFLPGLIGPSILPRARGLRDPSRRPRRWWSQAPPPATWPARRRQTKAAPAAAPA